MLEREERAPCIQASRPKSYISPEAASQAEKRAARAEGERGETSPCLGVCRPGKWGGETGKPELLLLLAAHSAQSPLSNPSVLAGRTVGRDTAGARRHTLSQEV